jgi:hypothetical protein
MKRAVITFLFAGVWLACASTDADPRAEFADCTAGQSRPCECPGAGTSTQTCDATRGQFGDCACTEKTPFPDAGTTAVSPRLCASSDAGVATADGGTRPAKRCQVCDFDVDPSEGTVCPVAPSCGNGNLGAPAKPTARPDLTVYTDNGKPVAIDGADKPPAAPPKGTCLDPQLRIRLAKLKVNKAGGEAYCIIEANDGVTSEAAVTMKTSALKDGDEFPFPVGQGTLWGQGMPECTSNNLTLTYYCFKVVDNSAWTAALKALGDTAATVGGSPAGGSPYGWAFGVGGAAANAAAAAIAAAQKDDNRIRVQQTIPVDGLLDLTNGRTWNIRSKVRDGCGLFGCDRDFDWELTVEAWGCADRLPAPR